MQFLNVESGSKASAGCSVSEARAPSEWRACLATPRAQQTAHKEKLTAACRTQDRYRALLDPKILEPDASRRVRHGEGQGRVCNQAADSSREQRKKNPNQPHLRRPPAEVLGDPAADSGQQGDLPFVSLRGCIH